MRSVDGDGPETVDLEKAKQMRTKILGKPLSPAERAFLVEKYQKNRTKRQVNLGSSSYYASFFVLGHLLCDIVPWYKEA